jgi:hypothetical protein
MGWLDILIGWQRIRVRGLVAAISDVSKLGFLETP